MYTRFSRAPPSPARSIRKRSYKNFDQGAFLTDLSKIDWSEVYQCINVDLAAEIFTRKFVQILNIHAPWVLYQQRKHYSPWITEATKEMIKKRDILKKKAGDLAVSGNITASNIAWKGFKKIRNEINNRRKYEEKRFKSEKLRQSLDSPAETWKTAKDFMNWKDSGGPPSQLIVNNKLTSKASSIASSMNLFFREKVQNIRSGIHHLPNNFLKCKDIMRNKNCKLSLSHVSVKKVNKLLKSLKNSKSTSIDELDNFCVKLAADLIDKPLHHIITLSIMSKTFPRSWKYSKVIPLHKSGCKLERKNYRPVAILSPLSKILEKIVYGQVYEYFTVNKIFDPNLHGYRQHRSTQTALMVMYDRWVQAAAAGQLSGAVLLDLSAAFDLVDHELLSKKLRIYGLEEDYICWIESYLSQRYQAVWIDRALSEFLPSEVGVPQGSNLGPLFFLIYFNDLPESIQDPVDSYADDTTITATGKTVHDIGRKLSRDCENVCTWMKSNKLKLNPGKTHLITLGTSQRLRISTQIEVYMDGVLLEENPEHSEVLLGCQIQGNLKWQKQVQVLKGKLRTRLIGLAKLKSFAQAAIRKNITEGIFNSVLVYCLSLFGGMDTGDLKDLQILQNKAAQIATLSPPRANRAAMFDKLGWLTITQLEFYHSVISVFKIRSSGEPEYLAARLSRDSRNGRIIIPTMELRLTQNSFTVRGAANWNRLPENVRRQLKIGILKKLVRKWILENISRFPD